MKPVGAYVRRKLNFHFAGAQITPCKHTGIPAACCRGTPNHSLHNQQIFWRLIASSSMRCFPELLASLGIKRLHKAISACIKNNSIVGNEFRPKIKTNLFRQESFSTSPCNIPGRTVPCLNFLAIVKIEMVLISRQGQWSNFRLISPQPSAGNGVVGFDLAWFFIPRKFFSNPSLIAGVMKGQERVQLPFRWAFQNKYLTAINNHFFSSFAAGQFVDQFSGCCIQHTDRLIYS